MGSHVLSPRIARAFVFVSLGIASLVAPVGCGSRHQDRSPGEAIDHAADDVSESVDEAGEEIDESVHGD
ncbi:MAG: hypothetical protein U0234_25300 [Sandaracinus sp.]